MKPLTKSRFALAATCSTKLYYANRKEYPDKRLDDSFMAALADGGYQVGELAKCMHPGGVNVDTLDIDQAVAETQALLQRENVVIFEAAIAWNDCLVRVDVLVKEARRIRLIEVKAKSFNSAGALPFVGTRGGLKSAWKPYLFDVAFQHYVVTGALPGFEVLPYLRLVDKAAIATMDGINQMFPIVTVNGRRQVKVDPAVRAAAGATGLLVDVPVLKLVNRIRTSEQIDARPFDDYIEWLLLHNRNNTMPEVRPGAKCNQCEFAVTTADLKPGEVSGFERCWSEAFGWQASDFDEPNVLEIWNNRKLGQLIANQQLKLEDVTRESIDGEEPNGGELNTRQRQWLQVKTRSVGDTAAYLAKNELEREMASWTYPLHLIDFETITPALPFTRTRHPYELVVFQFSHHKIHENGQVEHATQYLNSTIGEFPNVEFLRALMGTLSQDKGTVFRYSAHENTCLNTICDQIDLLASRVDDVDELIAFAQSLTHSPGSARVQRRGERCMVDLLELVKKYYYDPAMRGSNSIKYVLPAILNSSQWLQQRYGQPIYGASDNMTPNSIPSKNFKDWAWVEMDAGRVVDPYSKLPKLFPELSHSEEAEIASLEDIADGGAACTAYAKLQFVGMSPEERMALESGLLRYCELDTLAMVMIVEGWRDLLAATSDAVHKSST